MNACSCPTIDPSVSSPLSALCAPRESDAQLFARTKQFCCEYLHGRDSPRVQATSLWPLHAAKGTRPHAPPTAQMREGLRGSEGFAPSCSSSPGSLLLSLAGLAEVVQFARSVRLPLRNPRPNPSTHAPPPPNQPPPQPPGPPPGLVCATAAAAEATAARAALPPAAGRTGPAAVTVSWTRVRS